MRLDKYLCQTTGISRSQAREFIKKGCVTVNGEKAKMADDKVAEETDQVTLNGQPVKYAAFHYYLLNKPAGLITATKDKSEKTVLDCLKGCQVKNLFPVGRLDKDTEGLLLITDDGALAHNLLSPKKHVDKEYLVQLKEPITEEACSKLRSGVDIQDEKPTLPAKVIVEEECQIRLTIQEGRFHQVKRMLQAVGNEVVYLKRLSMGPLRLPEEMLPGEYRELNGEEIFALKNRMKTENQT